MSWAMTEEASLDMLGRAATVKVNKDNAVIVDGAGNPDDIKARIAQIKPRLRRPLDFDRSFRRLAKLSGGVAVIQVGAATKLNSGRS